MKRSIAGSCHCGEVRYHCTLDLQAGPQTTRCNCSICGKERYWFVAVAVAELQLDGGDGALTEYRFGSESVAHRFCRRCGIKTFGQFHHPALGPAYAVNVASLELTPAELAALPIHHADGRHDRQDPPAITSYL